MPDKSDFSWSNISVAALGGVAGAAIFAVVIRGGLGGLFFAHLAPLPLMIIGLGFGLRHCVTAALLSTAILSIYPHPVIGMAYGSDLAGFNQGASYGYGHDAKLCAGLAIIAGHRCHSR